LPRHSFNNVVIPNYDIASTIYSLTLLWRALEDHRRIRRSRGDHQDPHPLALACPRIAQISGAASRSVPSGRSFTQRFLLSGLATEPRIALASHSCKRQNRADMGCFRR
jgi:hypothetical protein